MGNRWCLVKQARSAPYPNPMYMANKSQQQPRMFYPGTNQVTTWVVIFCIRGA
jgi:hypothetical protein